MNITDVTNAALLELHREHRTARAAYQSGVPAWARDQQVRAMMKSFERWCGADCSA
jgi:hypothetical protein